VSTENRALRIQLQHDRIAALLSEVEREQGPIAPGVMEDVRDEWPSARREQDSPPLTSL